MLHVTISIVLLLVDQFDKIVSNLFIKILALVPALRAGPLNKIISS